MTNNQSPFSLGKSSTLLLVIAVLFIGIACNRTLDITPDHVEEVYPLIEGKERVYYVIDTTYSTTSSLGYDARTYYKKERTEGTEEDLLGRTVSKLWIYTSPDSTDSLGNNWFYWTYDDLWTQFIDERYAERTEGNTRYLVLAIPPVEGTGWNGNLFNQFEEQTYRYLTVDTTVVLNGTTYEHCGVCRADPFQISRYSGLKCIPH